MTFQPIPFAQPHPTSIPDIKKEAPVLSKNVVTHKREQDTHELIKPIEVSLFQRHISEDEPFTPSEFLQPFFQGKDTLSLVDVATLICQHIATLTYQPLEVITKTLSNSHFQTGPAFSIHCVQFLESIKSLPEQDPTLDNKIERSFEAYQNCLSSISHNKGPELQFFMTDLTILPPSLGLRVNLTKLNLWYNHLTSLPDSIASLTNLVTFSLSINNFTQFPTVILRLHNLTTLNFSRNAIESLPENFGDLKSLQSLDFSENRLRSLPNSFCQLINLKRLFLNENKLRALPSKFRRLTKLEKISLFKNKLTLLPESFNQLINLEYIDLSYNKLVILPDNMHNLTLLQSLMLNCNHLIDFDPQILKLPALQMLLLYENGLESELSLAIELFNKFGSVFTEKYCQPPLPFDEETHISYFEWID